MKKLRSSSLAVVMILLLAITSHCQSTHTADLSWNASTTGSVSSYNVYQGTIAGGPYSKIGTTNATTLQYHVTGLAPLTKYFWVTTSVCLVCVPSESINSNEASGTTKPDGQPTPPTATTVITIN